jgi:hypothetical protein
LLDQVDDKEAVDIYKALGTFFRKMHAIHNQRSELLIPFPNAPSPAEYMFQAEIINGSGKHACDYGLITSKAFDRTVALWGSNLDYLKSHLPTLISTSPFLWTIYLERDDRGWRVTKLTPMAELMWWDREYNLTFLKYPPFGQQKTHLWEAFLHHYGTKPERKRMLLHLVIQRLCAAMGVYKEPATTMTQSWKSKCLDDFDEILNEIEKLTKFLR